MFKRDWTMSLSLLTTPYSIVNTIGYVYSQYKDIFLQLRNQQTFTCDYYTKGGLIFNMIFGDTSTWMC